jgi:serine phosphatase RsbU (regulator of sigma subunit)
MKFTPGDFFSVTKENGIVSNQILHITEDDKGHIIIGTTEGVSKLKFKNELIHDVVNLTEEDGLIFHEVKYVYRDKHSYYWYGTSSGISIFKKNTHFRNIEIEDGLVDADVNIIKEINENEIWIGTSDGLSVLTIEDRSTMEFDIKSFSYSSGLGGVKVTFIEKDKDGNVWVGFSNGEINIFRQGRIIKPEQELILKNINTGFVDSKNNIWLGTEGKGLVKVEYDSDNKRIDSKRYKIDDGLISNFIYSITESKSGNIWIGSEKGVSKIVLDEKGEIKYVRSYDSEDGFYGLENNVNSILSDQNGNLWFGTVRGVMYLLSRHEDGIKKEAKLYINQIESNDFYYDWFDHGNTSGLFKVPTELNIPYLDNFIEIHFTGLYLSNPNDIEYSWRIKGKDKWSTFSKKDFIHFTNLNPGEYTVQIRSKTPENVISAEPLEFTFVIIEPFYMNIWFRIFIGLGIIGLGYLIYRWRVRKLKRQKEELELVVENRTQEISNQNEQLSVKNKEITDSINYAKRIQDTIIPSEERVKSLLGSESFVLFKPKDIVSGDFYWIREVDENTVIFSVADCTGHGVPGAMVSLVGANALHKAVGEFKIYKPSEILDRVNVLLNEAFSSEGKSVADGMDIAICKVTKKEGKTFLEYSGGNNPLWVFNPKRTSIPEKGVPINNADDEQVGFAIKPNKFGVGKFYANESFTNHELELFNDDEIIIFTDGYADQFGGTTISQKPMGKKFKYSRLKHLLAEIHHEHLDYQRDYLDKSIEDWRGDLEQVDDICMMGVKI